MATLNEPVIVIGTGRSGSSALHRLLAHHPSMSWLSGLCERYPRRPELNRRMMQVLDLPVVGPVLLRRYRPTEGYRFWDEYSRGFGRPFRDLTAADVTNRERGNIRRALAAAVAPSRKRLLIKITGWPRIGFLSEVFPDARFIHLVRDGRAVANSMLAVHFWDGWRGPGRWRWEELSPPHHAAWLSYGRSFVALAGLEWVMMQNAVETSSQQLDPSRFLEIRYEDFCADKELVLRQITSFAELPWTSAFSRDVQRYPVRSTNDKWRSDLTPDQQRMLHEVQQPYLEKYGYLD